MVAPDETSGRSQQSGARLGAGRISGTIEKLDDARLERIFRTDDEQAFVLNQRFEHL
jgi:hypothetical protein